MSEMIVGIDPDVTKSGIAWIKGGKLYCSSMSFWELLEFLRQNRDEISIVYLEGSFRNVHVWHSGKSPEALAAIAVRVGRNHQTGIFIMEFLQNLQINTKLVRLGRKLSKEEVNMKYGVVCASQDVRDAVCILMENMIKP